jgi:P pilus assembly chaperone PapD
MLLIAMFLLSAHDARAAEGGLATNNTRVDFANGENVQVIVISDSGGAPIHVQVRIMRWHDDGTHDVYAPTQDIGFSPALFTLAPHDRTTTATPSRSRRRWRGAASPTG